MCASLVYNVVLGTRERFPPRPRPYSLQLATELTLLFTSCDTQESGPCTSLPWAALLVEVDSQPQSCERVWESCPHSSSTVKRRHGWGR